MFQGYGGGIVCNNNSSPTITNCMIGENSAEEYGGGISCYVDSSPMISNCTIIGNSAGEQGGGIYCENDSSPTITNCTISENSAGWSGGGIICYGGSLTIGPAGCFDHLGTTVFELVTTADDVQDGTTYDNKHGDLPSELQGIVPTSITVTHSTQ